MKDRDVIEYFHIELETHEVVFAEGVAAETLQVVDGQETFANFVEYEKLYGDAPRPPMKPFGPCLGYAGGRAELRGLLRLACRRSGCLSLTHILTKQSVAPTFAVG